jgi:hypothetical protein
VDQFAGQIDLKEDSKDYASAAMEMSEQIQSKLGSQDTQTAQGYITDAILNSNKPTAKAAVDVVVKIQEAANKVITPSII